MSSVPFVNVNYQTGGTSPAASGNTPPTDASAHSVAAVAPSGDILTRGHLAVKGYSRQDVEAQWRRIDAWLYSVQASPSIRFEFMRFFESHMHPNGQAYAAQSKAIEGMLTSYARMQLLQRQLQDLNADSFTMPFEFDEDVLLIAYRNYVRKTMRYKRSAGPAVGAVMWFFHSVALWCFYLQLSREILKGMSLLMNVVALLAAAATTFGIESTAKSAMMGFRANGNEHVDPKVHGSSRYNVVSSTVFVVFMAAFSYAIYIADAEFLHQVWYKPLDQAHHYTAGMALLFFVLTFTFGHMKVTDELRLASAKKSLGKVNNKIREAIRQVHEYDRMNAQREAALRTWLFVNETIDEAESLAHQFVLPNGTIDPLAGPVIQAKLNTVLAARQTIVESAVSGTRVANMDAEVQSVEASQKLSPFQRLRALVARPQGA